MARKLSAYNLHVAKYVRSHPGMARKEAFRAAAASWSGHATRSNPDIRLPSGGNDMVKWLIIGVAAFFLLPKVLQGMQQTGPGDKGGFPRIEPSPMPMRSLKNMRF